MFSLIPPYLDQMFFGQNLALKNIGRVQIWRNVMKLFLTALIIVSAMFYMSIHTLAQGFVN
jgi:hypothetical protein